PGGFADGPLRQHRGEMFALLDGTAHVVDGPGRVLRGFGCGLDCLVRKRLTYERGDRVRHCQALGADGADGHARLGDVAALEAQVGTAVDHGDVHLVARDEALPGRTAVRLRGREVQVDNELAWAQDVGAGAG